METVINSAKKILIGVGFLFGIIFLLFITNQFVLLYDLLTRIHPYFAMAVTALVAAVVLYIVIRIAFLWFKSPKVAVLAENPTDEEYNQYLDKTLEILKKNRLLKDIDFEREDISKADKVALAFKHLDDLSFPLIKGNANQIFLSTAISQNGSLDSIVVLFNMTKMIWQLANIYQTRPSIKSMGKLYLQVAGVVFMARTLEDADLIEDQMEPLIATLVGESLASAIPGMVPITNLVVSSVMEGSLNAYLTLRVGIIAQSYLGMESPQTKSFIRRHASLQSVGYMGSMIKDNGKLVIKTIINGAKKATSDKARKFLKI